MAAASEKLQEFELERVLDHDIVSGQALNLVMDDARALKWTSLTPHRLLFAPGSCRRYQPKGRFHREDGTAIGDFWDPAHVQHQGRGEVR
jgi:hypothetical protein